MYRWSTQHCTSHVTDQLWLLSPGKLKASVTRCGKAVTVLMTARMECFQVVKNSAGHPLLWTLDKGSSPQCFSANWKVKRGKCIGKFLLRKRFQHPLHQPLERTFAVKTPTLLWHHFGHLVGKAPQRCKSAISTNFMSQRLCIVCRCM